MPATLSFPATANNEERLSSLDTSVVISSDVPANIAPRDVSTYLLLLSCSSSEK